MPSSFTPNYQLNQWEAEDRVLRTDFNADNAKIDAAIKAQADAREALAGQVALKADRSALAAEANAREALAGQVAQKVDTSALNALQTRVDQIDDRRARKLKTGVPLGSTAKSYSIDFSGIDIGQWKVLYLVITIPNSDALIGRSTSQATGVVGIGRSVLVFYPFFDGDAPTCCFNLRGGINGHLLDFGDTLKHITIYLYTANNAVPVGTTYEIWGEK